MGALGGGAVEKREEMGGEGEGPPAPHSVRVSSDIV